MVLVFELPMRDGNNAAYQAGLVGHNEFLNFL